MQETDASIEGNAAPAIWHVQGATSAAVCGARSRSKSARWSFNAQIELKDEKMRERNSIVRDSVVFQHSLRPPFGVQTWQDCRLSKTVCDTRRLFIEELLDWRGVKAVNWWQQSTESKAA